MLIIQCRTTF